MPTLSLSLLGLAAGLWLLLPVAALISLGATCVGTACLAGAFLWAPALTSRWTFTDRHLGSLPALAPGLLRLVGPGVKAGMWPFHLWLHSAHPAAPGDCDGRVGALPGACTTATPSGPWRSSGRRSTTHEAG